MKIDGMECTWSSSLPDMFTREAEIRLSSTAEKDGKMIVRGMRGIDGKPGKVLSEIKGEIKANDLVSLIRQFYGYVDLRRVRFEGEALEAGNFRFIREFSLEVNRQVLDMEITVETSLPGNEPWSMLERFMKRKIALVDNLVLKISIPGEGDTGFQENASKVVDALTGCIVAVRTQKLGNVSMAISFDSRSSINKFKDLVVELKDSCLNDDMFKNMQGVALNSFKISLLPVETGESVDVFASKAVEILNENMFSGRQSKVIPPSISRR